MTEQDGDQLSTSSEERLLLPDELRGSPQALLAANFHANVSRYLEEQVEGLQLRVHQSPLLEDLDDFFVETARDASRRIVIPLTCGSGKSTLGAWVADLAGIGRDNLTGLYVAGRNVGLGQQFETFQKYAPDMRIAFFDSDRGMDNLTDADLILMSYHAVATRDKGFWREFSAAVDLCILDEIHGGQGPETVSRLQDLVATSTGIFISATPRNAQEIYDIRRSAPRIGPVEAIQLGITNPARVMGLYSGTTVQFGSKEGEGGGFSKLIEHGERNELIVDTLYGLTVGGLQGIVKLHRGGRSKHARMIAEQLSDREIDGRKIDARAVGNFQPKRKNDETMEGFSEGEVDSLTFSDYLIESFDPPNGLGYVFSAEAFGSETQVEQLAGRGARFRIPPGVTNYLSLIDNYQTTRDTRRLYTFFDVYDIDRVEQGVTIEPTDERSPQGLARFSPRSRPDQGLGEFFDYFPERTRQALQSLSPGTQLDDLLLVRTEYTQPPEGYMPLVDLPIVRGGSLAYTTAQYLLEGLVTEDDRPLYVTAGGRLWALPEAQQTLVERGYIAERSKVVSRQDMTRFLEASGWPRPKFELVLEASGEAGAEYTTTSAKKVLIWQPDQAGKLLEHLTSIDFLDPNTEILMIDLMRAWGISHRSVFDKTIEENKEKFETHIRPRRVGRAPSPYKVLDTVSLAVAPDLIQATMDRSRGRGSARTRLRDKLLNANRFEVVAAARKHAQTVTLPGLKPIERSSIEAFVNQYLTPEEILGRVEQHLDHVLGGFAMYVAGGEADPDTEAQLTEALWGVRRRMSQVLGRISDLSPAPVGVTEPERSEEAIVEIDGHEPAISKESGPGETIQEADASPTEVQITDWEFPDEELTAWGLHIKNGELWDGKQKLTTHQALIACIKVAAAAERPLNERELVAEVLSAFPGIVNASNKQKGKKLIKEIQNMFQRLYIRSGWHVRSEGKGKNALLQLEIDPIERKPSG